MSGSANDINVMGENFVSKLYLYKSIKIGGGVGLGRLFGAIKPEAL